MTTVRRSPFIATFYEPLPEGLTAEQLKEAYKRSRSSDVVGTLPDALYEVTTIRFTVEQDHHKTERGAGRVIEYFTVTRSDAG